MSDYIETKLVDNWKEHSQHDKYDEQCSSCYREIRMFDSGDSEEDIEDIDEEVNSMFGIDLERLYESNRP
jgi:hypothetical protein